MFESLLNTLKVNFLLHLQRWMYCNVRYIIQCTGSTPSCQLHLWEDWLLVRSEITTEVSVLDSKLLTMYMAGVEKILARHDLFSHQEADAIQIYIFYSQSGPFYRQSCSYKYVWNYKLKLMFLDVPENWCSSCFTNVPTKLFNNWINRKIT